MYKEIDSTPSLGDVFREARVRAGLGLRELARNIGMTPSYLSDIENDRRVPAEEVLKTLATALNVDFDQVMSLAGRVGEQADRYLKRHPTAGLLFRRISNADLSEDDLKKLLQQADRLSRKK